MFSPLGPAGLAAKAVYRGAPRALSALQNLPGIGGLLGSRAAAAAVAGGAGAGVQDIGEEGIRGAGQMAAGEEPTAITEDLPERLPGDVFGGSLFGLGAHGIGNLARGYRTSLRGGRRPNEPDIPQERYGKADPSDLADDFGAMDRAGIQVRGIGKPIEYPADMLPDVAESVGKGMKPAELAAERLHPKVAAASVAKERAVKERYDAIREKYHESVEGRTGARGDTAVKGIDAIIARKTSEGRPLIAHDPVIAQFKKIQGEFLEPNVMTAIQAREMVPGGSGKMMSLEEAERVFGPGIRAKAEAYKAVDPMGRGSVAPGTSTRAELGTPDMLPPTGPPTAMELPATVPGGGPSVGPPSGVFEPMPGQSLPGVPPSPVSQGAQPPRDLVVWATPRHVTSRQLEDVIDRVDHLSKADTPGGKTDPVWGDVGKLLRDMRSELMRPSGIPEMDGLGAVVSGGGRDGKQLTGYAALMAKRDEELSAIQKTIEATGLPSKAGLMPKSTREDPWMPRTTATEDQALRGNLQSFGQSGRLEQNRAIRQLLDDNPVAKTELDKLEAYVAAQSVSDQARIFGGDSRGASVGLSATGKPHGFIGGVGRALKIRGEALARQLESSGADIPIGGNLLAMIRGEAPIAGPAMGGLLPEIGMTGGAFGARAAVTYNELQPQEKITLQSLLGSLQGED
jgi:hypothetical protein